VLARRAWWLTAALIVTAFVLPAGLPTWSAGPADVSAAAKAEEFAAEIDALPPELQQQILEILEAVKTGRFTREEALAALRELPGFSKLDAELREQIANSLRDASLDLQASDRSSAPDLSPGQTSADVQWAENAASRLANEEAAAETGEKNARRAGGPVRKDGSGRARRSGRSEPGSSGNESAGQGRRSDGRHHRHDAQER
jgi:hypothetical protein